MKHTSLTVQAWTKYLFVEEVAELKRLAQSLNPDPVIVNIGAGNGTSGLAFMEARDDVTLYTIDIQDESSPFGCLAGERAVFESAGYGHLLNTRWFQIHGDSKRVGLGWDGGMVDMVFIDGDHTWFGAMSDIQIWGLRLKDGGVISVHDYDKANVYKRDTPSDEQAPHPKAWPGVDKAVDHYLVPYYPILSLVKTLISFRKQ